MTKSGLAHPGQSRWRVLNLSLAGTSHARAGKPCEDYSGILTSDHAVIAVASDGGGSYTGSHFASKAVVEAYLGIAGADPGLLSADHGKKAMLEPTLERMLATATPELCPDGPHATLSAVSICGDLLRVQQIGDGAVFAGDGGHLTPLTVGHRGEHANETIFLCSPGALEAAEDRIVDASGITRFLVMTDGLKGAFVNGGMLNQDVAAVLFEVLGEHDDEAFMGHLERFLLSATVTDHSDDDLTLIIGQRD